MDGREAREALTARLAAAGFDLREATVADREAVVARRAEFRWEWFASRLHTFVVAIRVADLDEGLARELTDAAQLRSGTLFYFRGRMARGYIYGPYFRNLVEGIIGPALAGPPAPATRPTTS